MAEERKAELVAQLALARRDVTESRDRLAMELHPGHQLKKSVQNHPFGWFAGTMGLFTLVGLFGRRKVRIEKPRKKFRLFRWILGIAFSLAKPTLGKILVAKAKEEAAKRMKDGSLKSMLGTPPQR